MSMAMPFNNYRYPGAVDACRDGRHVEHFVTHNDPGPQLGRCGECGVELCHSFLPAWPGETWEGVLCTLPHGHSGNHQNRHVGQWWAR